MHFYLNAVFSTLPQIPSSQHQLKLFYRRFSVQLLPGAGPADCLPAGTGPPVASRCRFPVELSNGRHSQMPDARQAAWSHANMRLPCRCKRDCKRLCHECHGPVVTPKLHDLHKFCIQHTHTHITHTHTYIYIYNILNMNKGGFMDA